MSETATLPTLQAGLCHRQRMTVTPFHTVPEVDGSWPGFKDMSPVFARAMMIGFIEQTCIEALTRMSAKSKYRISSADRVMDIMPPTLYFSPMGDSLKLCKM